MRFVFVMLINSVLCLAIMTIMHYYGEPLIASIVPAQWVHLVTALVTLILCSPFLWMLMRADGDTPEVNRLWDSGARWRVRLTAFLCKVFWKHLYTPSTFRLFKTICNCLIYNMLS